MADDGWTLVGAPKKPVVQAKPAASKAPEKKGEAKPLSRPEQAIMEEWKAEQNTLKKQVVIKNQVDWTLEAGKENTLRYVAGLDISFLKTSNTDACAALIICSYPDYEVVYESFKHVKLTLPYIPGFLAFREVPFLLELLDEVKANRPELTPQLLLIDGNGILHPRGFGVACHLGVLTGIPAFGCGKTLFLIDGLDTQDIKEDFKANTHKAGDYTLLRGRSGAVHGAAYKSTDEVQNPIYLSPGHKVDMELMIEVARFLPFKGMQEEVASGNDLGVTISPVERRKLRSLLVDLLASDLPD